MTLTFLTPERNLTWAPEEPGDTSRVYSLQRPRQGCWPGFLGEGLSSDPMWLLPDVVTETVTDATGRAGECPSMWDSKPAAHPYGCLQCTVN